MIKLVPLESGAQLDRLCAENGVEYNNSVRAYVNAEGGEEAICIFSLDKYNMEILFIKYLGQDPLMPELLVRSTANYGANRSGYILRVNEKIGKNIEETLFTLNFKKENDMYIGKVPKILQGTCHCNKNV